MALIILKDKEMWRVIRAGLFVLGITKEETAPPESIWIRPHPHFRIEVSLDENGNLIRHPDLPDKPQEKEAYVAGGWRDPDLERKEA